MIKTSKPKEAAEEVLQKHLKEALDYKHALEESCIVARTDQDGIINFANDYFCKISKYSREELIGQDHRIINSGYHTKEFIANLWATIESGKTWRGEFKNKAKDGTFYWVDTTIVPFLNEGKKPNQYIAIKKEITERKTAEETLAKSIKEISDYKYALEESSIVAITDENGIIKYANQNFSKTSKYSVDELIGQSHLIIHPEYQSEEFIRNLWATVAKGNIWRGELKNKAKDGSVCWLDTSIIPFLNKQGIPYKYIVIRTDITERKGAEEALQRALEKLKKTQDELRMLLGDIQTSGEEERKRIAREIHDELGQVLTALKIDASMLRKKIVAKSNGDKKYVDEEFNSMIKLIDSTIGSVKRIATELRPEVLEHQGVIEAVKWQAKEFEKNTGTRCVIYDLQSHIEIEAPLATAIYRIVQEALTNIARHAKATVVNLLVGVDAKNFLIEIKDNGKGIKTEETEGIKSLGLIGMRERVLLLNGTISIIGKPGKGTIVSVKIPV